MIASLDSERWLHFQEITSTQEEAASRVTQGDQRYDVIIADSQTTGRGRFNRAWSSPANQSLSMTLIGWEFANHPQPWIIGMTLAVATAAALHAKVQWPNDVLLDGKKLAGILTEIVIDSKGRRIPIIGIGVNLSQERFAPELSEIATSLKLHRPDYELTAMETALRIIARANDLPDPTDWPTLKPIWMNFDCTPGKIYRTNDGQEAQSIGIGPNGELICAIDGETHSILAAEALFG